MELSFFSRHGSELAGVVPVGGEVGEGNGAREDMEHNKSNVTREKSGEARDECVMVHVGGVVYEGAIRGRDVGVGVGGCGKSVERGERRGGGTGCVCVAVVKERALLVGVSVEDWWEGVSSGMRCLSRGVVVM